MRLGKIKCAAICVGLCVGLQLFLFCEGLANCLSCRLLGLLVTSKCRRRGDDRRHVRSAQCYVGLLFYSLAVFVGGAIFLKCVIKMPCLSLCLT